MASGDRTQVQTRPDQNMSLPTPPPTHPTPLQIYIADHRAPILTATVVAQIGHWNYLTRYRHLNPADKAHRGRFGRLGLGWAVVYVGVLYAITVSMHSVKNASDRILRTRYP